MTTTATRRPIVTAPARRPVTATRPKTFNLRMPSTAGGPATAAMLAAFGQPRFTPAQQAANPGKPMTRVLKDILRPGDWHTDGGVWHVTRQKMLSLAENTAKLAAAGNRISLCNTHGDASGVVHPRDLIAPIDQVRLVGDILYCSTYVTPAVARQLSNPAMQVSVRASEQWTDGAGKSYGPVLLHVAVVDLPVVTNQGQFIELAGRPHPQLEKRLRQARQNAMIEKKVAILKAGRALVNMALAEGYGVPPPETETAVDLPIRLYRDDSHPPVYKGNTVIVSDSDGTWWWCEERRDGWKAKKEVKEKVYNAIKDGLREILEPTRTAVAKFIGLEVEPIPDDAEDTGGGQTVADLPLLVGMDAENTDMSHRPRQRQYQTGQRLTPAEIRVGVRLLGGR